LLTEDRKARRNSEFRIENVELGIGGEQKSRLSGNRRVRVK
jgi:hypothetical protein